MPLAPGDAYVENGLMVFTEQYHRKRGYCCGNGCRHCPYGHENVPFASNGSTEVARTRTNDPVLRSIEAQLYVADVEASCEFFASKLGFDVAFTYGDPPFYGQVRRDDARLNLRMVRGPVFVGDIREREQLLCASIAVGTAAEIERLFVDFEAAGVAFHQRLQKEPWGATTFVVADPDGNLILFAGPE